MEKCSHLKRGINKGRENSYSLEDAMTGGKSSSRKSGKRLKRREEVEDSREKMLANGKRFYCA